MAKYLLIKWSWWHELHGFWHGMGCKYGCKLVFCCRE